MRISRGFILSLVLVTVAAAAAYRQFEDRPDALPKGATPASHRQTPPRATGGFTEEQWTVMEVCDQVVFLLHPELIRQPPAGAVRLTAVADPAEAGAYTVTAGQAKGTLTLAETSVWDPVTYQPWCRAVAGPATVTTPAARPDILSALLTPETANFLAIDERLSAELAAHPHDAAVHVDAALLLGTMAWFDAAGHFQDVRPLLHRMTAFLAVADALGAKGHTREVAEMLRLVLVHDQAGAVAKITAARRAANGIPPPWLDALEVTATEDWRKTARTAGAGPMLLQLAHLRVLARNMSANQAETFLKTLNRPEGVQWVRYLTQSELGIGQGHRYARSLLGMEAAEANAVARACGRGSLLSPRESYVSFAKGFDGLTAYERPPQARVVGEQVWAGRTQRHLFQAMLVLHDFLRHRWGVPQQAAEFSAAMRGQFAAAYYYPFLALETAEAGSGPAKEAQSATEKITRERPASIAPKLWAALKAESPEGIARGTPDFHRFYNPEVPRHTSFEAGKRIYEIGVGDENSLPLLRGLLARCPYDYEMAFQTALVEGRPNNVEGRRFECNLQFADLSRKASAWVASDVYPNPQKYERIKLREAEGDPDAYVHLASYFEAQGDLARAERYLLLAHGKVDAVYFANAGGFLVRHYARTGRMAEAEAMAQEAADTYSQSGLGTLGWLQEYRQRWEDAARTYQAIDERYGTGSGSAHVAYVIRRKLAGAGWRPDYQAALDTMFPHGVEKVSLATLGSAPPRGGICFTQMTEKLRGAGIGPRDVVVGVDGIRVESREQYLAARGLSESPDMTLLVWEGQGYSEIKAHLPGRRFNVDLRTYQP